MSCSRCNYLYCICIRLDLGYGNTVERVDIEAMRSYAAGMAACHEPRMLAVLDDLEATRRRLENHRTALVAALNAEPSTSLEGCVEIAGKYRQGMLDAEAERNDARQAFDTCYGELGDAHTRADTAEQRVVKAVLALISAEVVTVDNADEHDLLTALMVAIADDKWRDYLPKEETDHG